MIRRFGWLPTIHAGTNDIGRFPKKLLMQLVAKTMNKVQQLLPEAEIVWSEILPRRSYAHVPDRDQMRADRVDSPWISEHAHGVDRQGFLLLHIRLSVMMTMHALYRQDGIHLSDVGIELFLQDVGRGIANMMWAASCKFILNAYQFLCQVKA